MRIVFGLIYFIFALFELALSIRIVFDLIQTFARQWRPSGLSLVLATVIYAVTDPPLRFLRRVLPPVRIGGTALDLGFLILFFGVALLGSFALILASSV